MAEFDDKLNSILGNPEIMNQIMSMAGALNQQSQNATPPQQTQQPQQPQSQSQTQAQNASMPFNPAAMQGMMEMLSKTQIDPKQRNLIHALQGYLPSDRVQKLEKAMQAAKIAKYASAALGKKSNTGR